MKNLTLLTAISFITSAEALEKLPKAPVEIIYGKDHREEIQEIDDQDFINLSKNVGIKVRNFRLNYDQEKEIFDFKKLKLGEANTSLCESERFYDQWVLGSCTGFLINPTTLLTAGHCMQIESDCKNFSWAFNFSKEKNHFLKNEVYKCSSIIDQKYIYTEKEVLDYAIIKLDRPVEQFQKFKTRKLGRPLIGTELAIIGHPLGLPLKFAAGAKIKLMNEEELKTPLKSFLRKENYMTANLDSYGGNSGSPVYNFNTKKIEGVLIQGAEDFELNEEEGCLVSRKVSNKHRNVFEKILRINKIPGINQFID